MRINVARFSATCFFRAYFLAEEMPKPCISSFKASISALILPIFSRLELASLGAPAFAGALASLRSKGESKGIFDLRNCRIARVPRWTTLYLTVRWGLPLICKDLSSWHTPSSSGILEISLFSRLRFWSLGSPRRPSAIFSTLLLLRSSVIISLSLARLGTVLISLNPKRSVWSWVRARTPRGNSNKLLFLRSRWTILVNFSLRAGGKLDSVFFLKYSSFRFLKSETTEGKELKSFFSKSST
mmetsp:Transcript_24185/g.42786  ORF Transcript_24185/g.42786 Transcript_24185/m.42786 type:complete len:242 (-) Transcript_24185:218-943(-)